MKSLNWGLSLEQDDFRRFCHGHPFLISLQVTHFKRVELCLHDVEISVFFLPKVDPLVSCAFTFLSVGGCWRPVSIGIERGNYRSFKTEVVQLKGN